MSMYALIIAKQIKWISYRFNSLNLWLDKIPVTLMEVRRDYSRVELMFARESPVSINCLCVFWTCEADFERLNTFRSQVWRYDIMISSMTLWYQVWRYDVMISSMTLWHYDLKYDVMISSMTLWQYDLKYHVMISSITLWSQVWRCDLKYDVMTLWSQVWRYDVGNMKIFHLSQQNLSTLVRWCDMFKILSIYPLHHLIYMNVRIELDNWTL
jgi:hypothetical protein